MRFRTKLDPHGESMHRAVVTVPISGIDYHDTRPTFRGSTAAIVESRD